MKFALDNEHFDHFKKNHWIELEEILPLEKVILLNDLIENELSKRLKCPQGVLHDQSPYLQFMAGRDLWRDNPEIKKWITFYRLVDIAAALTGQPLLRLGYDQYIPSYPPYADIPYNKLMDCQATLEEVSSFQGIACGLILCLKEGVEKIPMLPQKQGNITIFDLQAVVDFKKFAAEGTGSFLLCVYTKANAVYIFNSKDPNGHLLRDLGYNPGDRLIEKLHPTIHRG